MLFEYAVTITTNGTGDATVYAGSPGTTARGVVKAIKYAPGTLDTGAGITVTGEDTGVPILVKASLGTSTVWFYPKAKANANTNGAASTDAFEDIWIYQERIKVVVASGGDTLTGTITFYIDEQQ